MGTKYLHLVVFLGILSICGGQNCANAYYGRSCRNRCRCFSVNWDCQGAGGTCGACDVSGGYSVTPKCKRVWSCDSLMYGRSCINKCNCFDNTWDCQGKDCDRCDVEFGYSSAPKCQRANVAFKKTTSQKNPATGFPSDKGTDGLVLSSSTCSQTEADWTNNWWQVDLGQEYTVKWLDLYNTEENNCYNYLSGFTIADCEDLISGFRIHISNTWMTRSSSFPSDSTLCYTHDGQTGLTDVRPINIECTSPTTGRYVLVSLPSTNRNKLTVCELNVYQCEDYFFGRDCDKECNCASDREACDKITGACPQSGCMVGYEGTDCLTRCSTTGKFGTNCEGTCHCSDDGLCNTLTGVCGGGTCSAGWASKGTPNTCQTENIAYGKTATGSAAHNGNAVDGSLNRVGGRSGHGNCAISREPPRYKDNWWQVDLGREYTIKWLVYYNDPSTGNCYGGSTPSTNCRQLMRGFRVYVSTGPVTSYPTPTNSALCYRQTDATLDLRTAYRHTIGCSREMTGRYVIFTLANERMTVCELEIFQCEDGYFGKECNTECKCQNTEEVCNKVTGACTSGCRAGYGGTDCLTPCSDGEFGSGCRGTCRCVRTACNKATGSCTNAGGCAPGYVSAPGKNDCQRACTGSGKYGTNCFYDCHCRLGDSYCRNTDGTCTNGGCAQGYYSPRAPNNCRSTCIQGNFGYNCGTRCKCISDIQCSSTNGFCSGWCAAGYRNAQGTAVNNCQDECDGTFGQDCGNTCHCHTTCRHTDGDCGTGGCAAGWKSNGGNSCQTPCADGEYGRGCTGTCHCARQPDCNKETGSCSVAGGCAAGYVNHHSGRDDCQKPCNTGTFGVNCGSTCHCRDNRFCHNVHGSCPNNVRCTRGWRSASGKIDCQLPCVEGRYGYNCATTCTCFSDSECSTTDGVCSGDCKAGYYLPGRSCAFTCLSGKFGVNCQSTCHCHPSHRCSKTDGACDNGGRCAAGYINLPQSQIKNCQTACAAGTFGDGCAKTCNCKSEGYICDKVTGDCGEDGCADGWTGADCLRACPDGTFGFKCALKCNCNDTKEVCGKPDGACPKSGCPPGKVPVNCLSSCKLGKFGDGCKQDCHCRDSANTCDGESGVCTYGCAVGYIGSNCQDRCTPGKFGMNCSGTCNCVDGKVCQFETGKCDKCAPGYTADNCSVECANGTWGSECKEKCNCAVSTEACMRPTGHCSVSGCASGFEGAGCAVRITQGPIATTAEAIYENDTVTDGPGTSNAGAIAGGVIGAIVIIICICLALFFFLRYKRQRETKLEYKHSNGKPAPATSAYENTVVINENAVVITDNVTNAENEKQKVAAKPKAKPKPTPKPPPAVDPKQVQIELQARATPTPTPDEPETYDDDPNAVYCNFPTNASERTSISVANVWEDVGRKLEDPAILWDEYNSIPKGLLEPCTVAERPEFKGKCRFKGMLPYDHSRVTLTPLPGDPHSHFINANYMSSYKTEKDFIASQGPVPAILDDFWRMIWECNVDKVIMLTNLFEDGKKKCDQYWPDKDDVSFGGVNVEHVGIETYPDFIIRNLSASKGSKSRAVRQFHFTSWPDHGVPDDTTELISFWNIIKLAESQLTGKTVVHCSAGVGRTGTYLAFCYLMEKAAVESSINIHNHIENMRHERTTMIQTVEQYRFLYQVLRDALTYHSATIYLADSNNQLVTGVPRKKISQQYNMLEKMRADQEENGHTARMSDNMDKNRSEDIVAGEKARVVLNSQINGRTSYINAVFVKMYGGKHQVLSTCRPLDNTNVDFWRMVLEYHLTCIVSLDSFEKNDKRYWPSKGETKTYKPFTVNTTSVTEDRSWTCYDITVTHDGQSHSCKLLNLEAWDESGNKSVSSICQLIETAGAMRKEGDSQKMLVQCLDGVTRSGVFCAAMSAFQRMTSEKTVNVMATVKQMRLSRKRFITSQAQYQFVHKILMSQLEEGMTYENL